jgi:hypothetical protein
LLLLICVLVVLHPSGWADPRGLADKGRKVGRNRLDLGEDLNARRPVY